MGRRLIPSRALPTRRRLAARAGDDYGMSDLPDWRDVDWQSHVGEMTIKGRRVQYVDIGAGREESPVVFVHGLAGCWQNWLENLPRVARHRRAIALDLPGFGHSEMPADAISITSYAHTVEELCGRLELDAVAVVGNSMGGFVGAELASSFPARVERLMLVSAAGISHTQLMRRPALTASRIGMLLATGTASQHRTILARPRLRHIALATILRHPTRLELDLLLEQAPRTGLPGFVFAVEAIISYDIRDRLPEIACPTLVIQGANDMLVPVRDAHEFARLIPKAREVIWPETGHAPQLERPVRFNDALLEFLEELPAPVGVSRAEGRRAWSARWRTVLRRAS